MLPSPQHTLVSVQEPIITETREVAETHAQGCPVFHQQPPLTPPPSFVPRECPVTGGTLEKPTVPHPAQPVPTHLLPTTERLRKALCSAGFASIIATMITGLLWQPLMTVLVRQQFIAAQKHNIQLKPTSTTSITAESITNAAKAKIELSSWSVARNISREGKRIFFRGLTPRLMQSPLACVQWTTYEVFRETLANANESWLSRFKYACVFVLARVLVTATKCPFEVVKERMQVQGTMVNFTALGPKSTSWQHFRHVIKNDGVGGLFRALPINICRDIPIAVIMMVGNDFFTHLLLNKTPIGFIDKYFAQDKANRQRGGKTPSHISFAAGALSGLVATVVTQPIDVAKTAIQTQSLATAAMATQPATPLGLGGINGALTSTTPVQFKGLFSTLGHLQRTQGISSWFTGTPLRATHLILGGAVYLPIYRKVQQQLKFRLDTPHKSVQ